MLPTILLPCLLYLLRKNEIRVRRHRILLEKKFANIISARSKKFAVVISIPSPINCFIKHSLFLSFPPLLPFPHLSCSWTYHCVNAFLFEFSLITHMQKKTLPLLYKLSYIVNSRDSTEYWQLVLLPYFFKVQSTKTSMCVLRYCNF